MSFVSDIESFFKKVFGSTKWEQTASTAIALLSPMVVSVVAETSGEADAAEIQSIVAQVQNGLSVVATTVAAATGSAPGASVATTIVSTLNAVNANLSTILTAGHVKDAATQSKVAALFSAVSGEISAIISVVQKAQE